MPIVKDLHAVLSEKPESKSFSRINFFYEAGMALFIFK
jgi:hypothetical protein